MTTYHPRTGKPIARWGHKAAGLFTEAAGLPKGWLQYEKRAPSRLMRRSGSRASLPRLSLVKGTRMKSWIRTIKRLIESEDGPTAVEYAVMLALIVVVCIAAITALGGNSNKVFSNVALNSAAGSTSS